MIKIIVFLWPLIASCNGFSKSIVYNMDQEGSSGQQQLPKEKYKRFYERLTDFEESLSEEVKKSYPNYSAEMAYLTKSFMEHFDTIDPDTFYSHFYIGQLSYFQKLHILLPLAISAGSDKIVQAFLSFLKQQGYNLDTKDILDPLGFNHP